MATTTLIFYNSGNATGQSALVKEIAKLKYTVPDCTITVKDTVGMTKANLVTYIGTTLTALAGTFDDVVIAQPIDAYLDNDIVAYCDILLKTAKKTTILIGTCGTNSTVTNIILTVGLR